MLGPRHPYIQIWRVRTSGLARLHAQRTKPCPTLLTATPIVVLPLASGVPSLQLNWLGSAARVTVPAVTNLYVLSWALTFALRSNELAVVKHQSAQSAVPSLDKFTALGATLLVPTKLPTTGVLVAVAVDVFGAIGVLVHVAVDVLVAVPVGVVVDVAVAVPVDVAVDVFVPVPGALIVVGVLVAVGVLVNVAVGVLVAVPVLVDVAVDVLVAVRVAVTVGLEPAPTRG